MNNVYNTTDLDPLKAFEKHIFHRDMFAHYLRRNFLLKEAKIWEVICDFGCGNWNAFEVLYRNRYKPKNYVWLDIRQSAINKANDKFDLDYASFICEDLVTLENWTNIDEIKADKVISFEVLEHVWKKNAKKFLENMMRCWNDDAIYFINTPNYDESVWAAWNHTYPDYKWWDPVIQEFEHYELEKLIKEVWFNIKDKIWTFASQKDYKKDLDWRRLEMFNWLVTKFDSNIVSVVMWPFIDASKARNTLWILTK